MWTVTLLLKPVVVMGHLLGGFAPRWDAPVIRELLQVPGALLLDVGCRKGELTLDVPANRLSISVINRYLELKERMLL